MKKIALTVLAMLMAAGALAATTAPADAASGWSTKMARSSCDTGQLVTWHRLGVSGQQQGRVYVYKMSTGRLCAFTVDHMPGAHKLVIKIGPSTGGWYATDSGVYNEYAGAVAAPAKLRCINVDAAAYTPTGHGWAGQVCK